MSVQERQAYPVRFQAVGPCISRERGSRKNAIGTGLDVVDRGNLAVILPAED